jgi:hypothetical protein
MMEKVLSGGTLTQGRRGAQEDRHAWLYANAAVALDAEAKRRLAKRPMGHIAAGIAATHRKGAGQSILPVGDNEQIGHVI